MKFVGFVTWYKGVCVIERERKEEGTLEEKWKDVTELKDGDPILWNADT